MRLNLFRRTGAVVAVLLVALLAVVILSKVPGFALAADTGGTTGLGFDDPYTQIVNHNVAVQPEARLPIQPDGKPTYFPGGRYYTGKNGLEIRFDSTGTVNAAKVVVVADSSIIGTEALGTGVITLAGDVAISSINPTGLRNAAAAVTNLANAVGAFDGVYKAVLQGYCLGITIPPTGIVSALNRGLALMSGGNSVAAFQKSTPNDIKVWMEKCAPGDPDLKDVAAPPPPPSAADIQPAVPAQPIPVTPEKPVQIVPQPQNAAPQPPAPVVVVPSPPVSQLVNHEVSMTETCQRGHPNAARENPDHYGDWNDKDSWYCVDDAGNTIGGVDIQRDYCDIYWDGSRAVNIDGTAFGWKCQREE